MSKTVKIVIGLLFIVVVLVILFLVFQSNSQKYQIHILDFNRITSVSVDALTQKDNIEEFNDKETIEKIYRIFSNKTTNKESIYDNPTNPDELYFVTFKDNEDHYSSAYIYKRSNNYYIEQPYNGIYSSSSTDFKFVQSLMKQ